MEKRDLWKMASLWVGLAAAALLAGCSTTCSSCKSGPAPVGERTDDVTTLNTAPMPDLGGSYDPVGARLQRTWPYGTTLAAPTIRH